LVFEIKTVGSLVYFDVRTLNCTVNYFGSLGHTLDNRAIVF
jgi:hypothetical protein